MALLLPPLAGGDGRRAPLHVARQGQRRAADLGERPARLDAHVDVDAARAGRLGPADQADASSASLATSATSRTCVPGHARHRIEVDAQLVGMVEVLGADRMRVEVDAAEVDDPEQLRRRPAARSRRRFGRTGSCSSTVSIQSGRDSGARFWKKKSPAGAVDEALERHRPAAGASQRSVGHGPVVRDQVALGVAASRERRPCPGWRSSPRGRRWSASRAFWPCRHGSRTGCAGAVSPPAADATLRAG